VPLFADLDGVDGLVTDSLYGLGEAEDEIDLQSEELPDIALNGTKMQPLEE
jgi:hypothetical protein